MRHATFALLVLAGATGAAAQTGQQPNIVLTIFAGAGTGHDLWVIPKQPLEVLGTSEYDTLRLGRSISSSLVLGADRDVFPLAAPRVSCGDRLCRFPDRRWMRRGFLQPRPTG